MKLNLPRFLIASLVAIILLSVFILMEQDKSLQPLSRLENEEEEREDGMQKAWAHEFLVTKDPVLNRIPKERIIEAKHRMDEMGSQSKPGDINSLAWLERGPNNIGGRTRALLVDRNDGTGNTVFAAGVGGGLWKTTNFKTTCTWTVVNDFFSNIAITCIKQNPNNFSELYFGTGEGWGNIDAIDGLGIWRSTNSGSTWTQLSSTASISYVNDLEFDNNGYIYAATRASVSGQRGVLRSTDGGTNWTQVLTDPDINVTTRGADLEIASNGDMYASLGIFTLGHVFRSASNGTNTGIGGSWTEITPPNLTSNAYQRTEITIAPSNSARIYAIAQNDAAPNGVGAIYRSDNSGGSWATLTGYSWCDQGASTTADFSRGQAWYDLILSVDPNNADVLMAGGVVIVKTANAGTSWTQATRWTSSASCTSAPVIHADIHEILFLSSTELIIGTDGGIYYSSNGGTSFTAKNTGYNVTQYYGMAVSPTSGSNNMIGGTQDNGSHLFSSAGVNSVSSVTGGDGGFCFIDKTNSTVWMTSNPGGFWNIYRSSGTFIGTAGSGNGRFISVADYADTLNVLYYGDGEGLYGRVFNVESGSASFGTVNLGSEMGANRQVSCVKVDPADETIIWLGCSVSETAGANVAPNLLKVIRANGPTMGPPANQPSATAFAGPALVAGSYISNIDIEPGNSNHMLLTVSNFGVTSVWESTNGGTNWTSVEGNLPDMPVRWGLFIPSGYMARTEAIGGVMLATELGVWSTAALNGGSTVWAANNTGLANVRTDQLVLRSSDKLVAAATHGRGVFTATLLTNPLPVTLIDFSGRIQNKNALLEWTTATEYNSKYFELERSFDGINFRKIATIIAAGNSTTTLHYSYVDREPLTEKNFYRLRMVDIDNGSKLSNVILLQLAGANQDILVLGNPFNNNRLTIRFVRALTAKGELRLNDMSGRLVARKIIGPGEQQVAFNIPPVASGTYLLQAIVDNKIYTSKVLKE